MLVFANVRQGLKLLTGQTVKNAIKEKKNQKPTTRENLANMKAKLTSEFSPKSMLPF